ncbi:MAG: hypothetical protein CMH75_03755 [Nitrospina sp.]|nr:hypothetical protein [Nitrospina sp.]|tara:strand:- start:2 stop:322 length:321 start_codon:yes stop_codon:yes gene_type:complete
MPKAQGKKEIYLGMALIGSTGLLIGLVMASPLLMIIAGFLGIVVGGFVGWLGGRRYMLIICLGVFIGGYLGYRTGDRDILIIASGTGGAIAGFLGAQIELFFNRQH